MTTKKEAKKKVPRGKLGATDPELKEAPAPGEVPAAPVAAAPADVPTVAAGVQLPGGFGKDAVDVVKDNRYIRQFSLEVHGDGWKALAKEFIEGHAGCTLVDPSKIKAVVVTYKAEAFSGEGRNRIYIGMREHREPYTDKKAALTRAAQFPEAQVLVGA
jgi:hypothetical protein